MATWNRAHNDGNCLSIGQRTVSPDEAIKIVQTWLTTEFEGGRHIARIKKIDP
jgi:ribose 5-phosphate isomerase B